MAQPDERQNLVTRRQLAAELSVTGRTIQSLEKRGLPVIELSARCVRYDRAAVAEFLRNRTRTGTTLAG